MLRRLYLEQRERDTNIADVRKFHENYNKALKATPDPKEMLIKDMQQEIEAKKERDRKSKELSKKVEQWIKDGDIEELS